MAYRKVIEVNPLSRKSINNAIRELRDYKKEVENLKDEFLLKLGIRIESHLNALYTNGATDFNQDYEISVDPMPNGLEVKASGTSVAFIEFGAGATAGNGQYEHPHEEFYPGAWSEQHADTWWVYQHSNNPNVEYRWNQDAIHGFDDVINNMHRWVKECADEVFG